MSLVPAQRDQSHLMAWNTDLPIICGPMESTFEVAKKMAAQKNNCALVRDNSRKRIIGIFTAKDLAFKVVSRGLHSKLLKARDIMTPNPICATVDEPASSALNKMIKYRIRHLPVLDAQGNCVGLLDITKCFNQTLERLRKLHQSSQKLNEALMEVQENIANMNHDDENIEKHSEMYYQAQDMVLKAKDNINSLYQNNLALTGEVSNDFEDYEALLNLMESPTLNDILKRPDHTQTLFIDANNTIRNAADIMKKNNTTAVLVRDTTTSAKSVIGILTTKDIVYRVLAEDNEPDFTIISRVMTPSPEFGDSLMGIVEAFEIMYKGHFLNLPVTDENENVAGLVSVMQLTSMALSQLHKGMLDKGEGQDVDNPFLEGSPVANPKWDRFWGNMEFGGSKFEEDTLRSDYSIRSSGPPIRSSKSNIHSSTKIKNIASPRPNYSRSLNGTTLSNLDSPVRSSGYAYNEDDDMDSLGCSEVSPEDSVSCFNPPTSEVNSVLSYTSEMRRNHVLKAQKQIFSFKLKDLDDGNRTYKIKIMLPKSKNLLPNLKSAIEEKVGINTTNISLSYIDEDGDSLTVTNEEDLRTAIEVSSLQKKNHVVLCMAQKLVGSKETNKEQILKDISDISRKMNSELPDKTINGVADMLSKPEVLISGALLTLSLGILVGVTLSRK